MFLIQRLLCKKRLKKTILQKIRQQNSKELTVIKEKEKITGSENDTTQDTANAAKIYLMTSRNQESHQLHYVTA